MDFSTTAWISSRAADRLTSALTDFLWQGAAIGLAVALLLRMLRSAGPETRHGVCALGMLVMASVPVATWITHEPGAVPALPSQPMGAREDAKPDPAGRGSGAPKREVTRRDGYFTGRAGLSEAALTPVTGGRKRAGFCAAAWMGGVALLGLWRIAGWRRLVSLRTASLDAPEALSERVTALARRMGVRAAPMVRLTRRLVSPAVMGVWRPVILLPVAVLSGLSARELDTILAHELAHVRRRDFLLNSLQCSVETLLFYHPAVWWLSRRMRLERELCCDDAAAAATSDRAGCARALARLAELCCASPCPPAPAAADGPLARRIRRLLENGEAQPASGALTAGPLTAAALLFLTLPAGDATAQSSGPSLRGEILDRQGLVLARSAPAELSYQNRVTHQRREYPYRALAGHALGYTVISPDADGLSGIAGLEKTLDKELNTPGGGVRLTLDARLQRMVDDVFHDSGATRGAAVLMDARNGDILAMASFPDLDIGLFSPVISGEEWSALNQDPARPLINRAMSGLAPGSTFKIITALAGDSAGLTGREYPCDGHVEYGGRDFACWTVQRKLAGHGVIPLREALERSCNCYFYQLGNDAGPDRIAAVAEMFGIGDTVETGPILHGRSDFMPTHKWWMKKNMGPWTSAKTANISIGQGEVLATPLQMTTVAAAVANGGTVWRPRIVSHVREHGVWTERPPVARGNLSERGVTPDGIAAIRQGMRDAVNGTEGTARRAESRTLPIAGKTGSAQMWRVDGATRKREPDNHAWFIGYAPADAPRYAVGVVVANAQAGGAVSAPIARRILVRAAAAQTAVPAEPRPLLPVKGNFRHLEEVAYPDRD